LRGIIILSRIESNFFKKKIEFEQIGFGREEKKKGRKRRKKL